MKIQSEIKNVLEDKMNEAVSYFMSQQFPEAENRFRIILEQDPGNLSAANNLAETLRSQGKVEEAISLFRQILESSPDDPIVWKNLGICLQQARNCNQRWGFTRNRGRR